MSYLKKLGIFLLIAVMMMTFAACGSSTKAFEGTLLAHTDGDVTILLVKIPEMDAYTLGYTMYFFEIAVGISGYLNGINPFDQPGVEAYKKNMFALLGKPGFEDLAKELNERL